MSITIETKIETAWKSLLEADAYVVANSIPVQVMRDVTNERSGDMIVINVEMVQNEIPNSTLWMCNTEIQSTTYTMDDKDKASLNAIYEACLGVAKNSTNAQLTTAGSITFNNTDIIDSGSQLYDDDGYQIKIINIECHIQA